MARRNKKQIKAAEQKRERKKLATKKNFITLLELLGTIAVVFVTYRVLMNFRFFDIVLIIYMVLAAICVFTYVIYNRGMSRVNVTPEMLPDDWSDEQKQEFIDDGKRRLQRSKPLLMLTFAFAFTFSVRVKAKSKVISLSPRLLTTSVTSFLSCCSVME